MIAFFKKIQNLGKPSETPVCLGGASREPHLVLSKVVILCSRVTYRSKDKKKKKSGKFLHYTLTCSLRTYLLSAEFSVRTVNYGPSFFASIYGKQRGSVIYSTDRKNEANKMFIIWLLPVWGTGNKCRTHDLTVT